MWAGPTGKLQTVPGMVSGTDESRCSAFLVLVFLLICPESLLALALVLAHLLSLLFSFLSSFFLPPTMSGAARFEQ